MSFVFDYVRSANGMYYPLVPVQLKYRLRVATVESLVDSGATISIFNLSFAEELGINLNKAQKIDLEGVGGNIVGYLKTISMVVGEKQLRAPVIFTDQFTSVNLLGRKGVFDVLDVCFSDSDRKVRFTALS